MTARRGAPPRTPTPWHPRRLLVALGGNAIQRAHDRGTWDEAVRQVRRTATVLARIARPGRELLVTHGNGPQVGNLLREAELASGEIPAPPLHVLDAESQGQIGYLIAQELSSAFQRARRPRWVLPVISRVEVSPRDPAFRHPTKPIGNFYPARDAKALQERFGWTMKEDAARGGWRRLVPSPTPRKWLEAAALREMLDAGLGNQGVFVVSGGGGIPVVRRRGRWEGVDAVIDKDLAGAMVAKYLDVDTYAIVTDVPGAALHYGGSHPEWLGRVGLAELTRYWKGGEFAEGSMGPKVEAGIRFLRSGGKAFVICDIRSLPAALAGRTGTRVER